MRELSSMHVLRLAVVDCSPDRAACARFGLHPDATAPVLRAWHLPGSAPARLEQGVPISAVVVDGKGTVHLRADDMGAYCAEIARKGLRWPEV